MGFTIDVKDTLASMLASVLCVEYAFAAIESLDGAFQQYGAIVSEIINLIVRLVQIGVVLAFCLFLYNIVRFVMGDAKEKEGRKSKIFFDLIAMFILVSVWGIVAFYSAFILGSEGDATTNQPNLIQIGAYKF